MIARWAAGAVVAALAVLALVAASRAPLVVHRAPDAMLRLAWTARPERIERCTTVSREELAALPEHMRQHEVCEGTTARYAVAVHRDGVLVRADTLRGGGLRHDRQLYYFQELRVPPGPSTIDVQVTRLDSSTVARDEASHEGRNDERDDDRDDHGRGDRDEFAPGARREQEERRRRVADDIPPMLRLRETVTLAPREVLLVTYDRAAHRFRILRHEAHDAP